MRTTGRYKEVRSIGRASHKWLPTIHGDHLARFLNKQNRSNMTILKLVSFLFFTNNDDGVTRR